MPIRLCGAALALSLAACAPLDAPAEPSAPRSSEMRCDADRGQSYVGQKASSATGEALLRATGARLLRWVAPGMMVTMDYRPDRLTVHYDDAYTITQVTCG